MKATVVRYQTHPEHADRNEALVREVFAELAARQTAGLSYLSVRVDHPDQAPEFVHVAFTAPGIERTPLLDLPSFRAFQAELRARCVAGPLVAEGILVGSHLAGPNG